MAHQVPDVEEALGHLVAGAHAGELDLLDQAVVAQARELRGDRRHLDRRRFGELARGDRVPVQRDRVDHRALLLGLIFLDPALVEGRRLVEQDFEVGEGRVGVLGLEQPIGQREHARIAAGEGVQRAQPLGFGGENLQHALALFLARQGETAQAADSSSALSGSSTCGRKNS